MKKPSSQAIVQLRTAAVFLLTLLIAGIACWLFFDNNKKDAQMQASFTAQSTVSRIEAQLNRYLAESDLMKNLIESGHMVDETQFRLLSRMMQDSDHVIEAHELAKDGTVDMVYPLSGNKQAMGLDMLTHPARKYEATLARDSGEYTIAGPFDLVQGGTGALLFDPIYTTDASGQQQFWGFSILVLNWEKFMEDVEVSQLEDAGYCYRIWKADPYTEDEVTIAQSQRLPAADTLQVACSVPNDTWYVEIIPCNGWISGSRILIGIFLSLLLASCICAGYWQFEMRRLREAAHEAEIERSAQEAREANEAKTRFLFNMSHDIRTPMNAIIGFSDLLEKHIDDPQRVRTYLEKIKSASSFLLSLINYVLETARIESGKATLKNEVGYLPNLVESLNAVFEPNVQEKHLNYSCRTDIQHPYVICDRTKIREILLNIISNSVKYTPDGGSVTVTIDERPADKADHALYRIVVTDTGIGMSPEYLPHIFEEFTREHTSTESKVIGTGLGLPIVKALVGLMGGTIDVQSTEGKGSTFTVMLPFEISDKETYLAAQEPKVEVTAAALAGKRILVAEDNDINAEITVTLLEENGLLTERAEDGAKCLAAIQQHPAGYYDAVLMDIQMPGMDGYETTRAIRALADDRAQVPIIAMTANAFEEDRQKAFAVGMDAHLAKPIRMDTLFATLQRVLGAKG